MSEQKEGSVQFSPEDFRTWNEAGFEEVSAALVEARRRFTESDSLREKELAQMRLDSLEQLYRLASQVARERFERARDDAADRLHVVVEKLQATPVPVVTADRIWQRVSSASVAFAAKRFNQVITELATVEAEIVREPRRSPACTPLTPATTSAAQPELPVNSNSLLGLAAQHEQSGRRGVACRLYLRALVQSASNTADQR
jgi:hypothetical protein